MPGLTGLQAAEMINQEKPVPFVLVTGHADAIILQGQHAYIMACLSKPIRPVDLIISITLARKRFEEYQHMTREANNLRQALEDRKLIERAKGTAMKRLRIDEEEAFVRLQRLASERNTKLAEIARQVIVADEIFQHLDRL
jgi:response regulator NasT